MKESLLEVKKQNEEREKKEEEEAWCKYNKVEIVQVKYQYCNNGFDRI